MWCYDWTNKHWTKWQYPTTVDQVKRVITGDRVEVFLIISKIKLLFVLFHLRVLVSVRALDDTGDEGRQQQDLCSKMGTKKKNVSKTCTRQFHCILYRGSQIQELLKSCVQFLHAAKLRVPITNIHHCKHRTRCVIKQKPLLNRLVGIIDDNKP